MLNAKIENDNINTQRGLKIHNFDEFFYEYMKERYKLEKVINNNCEQVVGAIFKYQYADKRIDIYRRFLNIEPEPIRVEILDSYLQILKSKTYFK